MSTDDLVNRFSRELAYMRCGSCRDDLELARDTLDEAADTIERLQRELVEQDAQIARLERVACDDEDKHRDELAARDKTIDAMQECVELLETIRASGDWYSSALEFTHCEGLKLHAKVSAFLAASSRRLG